MNIVVCVKQTPDTAATLALKDGHVAWGDSPMIVNPWDEYAVEEALRLKEKHGGKVTDSVSRSTNYLVVGEAPGGTKIRRAQELGTPVIDEARLREMIAQESR